MQIIQIIAMLAVTGGLTVGLCRLLRLEPVYPEIAKPQRSALCSIASVLVSMLVIYALALLASKHGPAHGGGHKELLPDLGNQVFVLLVYFLPMWLMLRLNGEKLHSIGLTSVNLWKAAVVGIFLAATPLVFTPGGLGAAFKFTENHNLHSLIYFSLVSFGEEILFRGYLQGRLVAWLGQYQGLSLATVIFAVAHLPLTMLSQGIGFVDGVVITLVLIGAGLLMGFVMLRTGNVVPGGLFHTFVNWMSHS